MTRKCLSVRDDFFDFPIDFFGGLPPSLYADQVLCAAFRAALTPHILFGWRKNRKMAKPYTSARNAFLWNGSAKVELWCRRELNFHVFYFSQQKIPKKCPRILRKLSSRSNQSSTFAIFGGSKMSLQKLSGRQHDFTIFPKTRFYVTKKSQKFKVSIFSRELALTCR